MKITKELLEELLKKGFSGNEIGRKLGYTGTGIRWHMKKWGLSSNFISISERKCLRTDTHKQCPKCKEIKEIKEFSIRPNGNIASYCMECVNKNRYTLMRTHKLEIIKELGSKCSICGYDKNTAALEFHHLDKDKKDFHISNSKTTNINKIKKEIDKCILVCANCHREIHYPQNEIKKL